MKQANSFRTGKFFRILSCILCAFALILLIFDSSVIAKAYDKDILNQEFPILDYPCYGISFDSDGKMQFENGKWTETHGLSYCSTREPKKSFIASLFRANFNTSRFAPDWCVLQLQNGMCSMGQITFGNTCIAVPGTQFGCN